jgi:dolichyl-phosphate beta-glucosyltransferase
MSKIPNEAPGESVLLVIPAFRESRRLPLFLRPLLTALCESGLSVCVRVVDDGSPVPERDSVATLCRNLSTEFPALLPMMGLPANLGKGGAVYAGWDAEGESGWLGFCDADGSVGPDEVVRLIRILFVNDTGVDALIASRHAGRAKPVSRSLWRGALSRIFSAWVRLVTKLAVRDSQCGCKFVRRDVFVRVRPELGELRFAFDVELLSRLASAGASIREEPVAWSGRSGGSLSVVRDGMRMAFTVLRFRRRV